MHHFFQSSFLFSACPFQLLHYSILLYIVFFNHLSCSSACPFQLLFHYPILLSSFLNRLSCSMHVPSNFFAVKILPNHILEVLCWLSLSTKFLFYHWWIHGLFFNHVDIIISKSKYLFCLLLFLFLKLLYLFFKPF